jgi:hypothetical protein
MNFKYDTCVVFDLNLNRREQGGMEQGQRAGAGSDHDGSKESKGAGPD